jgi:hypothetical protein
MQAPRPKPAPWSIAYTVAGVLSVLLSLCISCLALSLVLDTRARPDPDDPSPETWLLCFLCFGLPLMAAGIAALVMALRRRKQEQAQTLQNIVLDVAMQQGGSVTAQDLAFHSSLSLEAAQDLLEGWAARGICRMEVDTAGFTRFWFDSRPSSRETPL